MHPHHDRVAAVGALRHLGRAIAARAQMAAWHCDMRLRVGEADNNACTSWSSRRQSWSRAHFLLFAAMALWHARSGNARRLQLRCGRGARAAAHARGARSVRSSMVRTSRIWRVLCAWSLVCQQGRPIVPRRCWRWHAGRRSRPRCWGGAAWTTLSKSGRYR